MNYPQISQKADIQLEVTGNQVNNKSWNWTLTDPQGKTVMKEAGKPGELTANIL